jgi:5-methylthioribose kinase
MPEVSERERLAADPYRVLGSQEIAPLLAGWPAIARRLGGSPADWTVQDVADGNLNAVYLVEGPEDGVCVKQSLPYVRVAKDDWPLSVDRGYFESQYMQRVAPFVAGWVPQFLHFDASLRVIVMQRLRPHVILRSALIAGQRHETAASAVADFAAAALFHTSDISNPFERKFQDVALFSQNHDLQRITLDLVFIDPFQVHPRNRHASPQLDGLARALREDVPLKAAVARLRNAYLAKPQALLHGDLHSGSVLVTPDDTRVIDGEFAWVGPIGFDTGMFIANLLMCWYAKAGHEADVASRNSFRAWLLEQVTAFWRRFDAQFMRHWKACRGPGDGYPSSHFADAPGAAGLHSLQQDFLQDVWADSLGFAGIEIIRRTIGFSQIADFGAIVDVDLRSRQQGAAIALARDLLLQPARYPDVAALVAAVPGFEPV